MNKESSPADSGYASPLEMQDWLLQEVKDSAKALDLRLREATDLVREYTTGKLSAQQAADALFRYQQRWGDALFGATAGREVTDDQILAAIDDARSKQWTDRLADSKTVMSR
jgi:hypothetical protein